jgi:hypothetical protein
VLMTKLPCLQEVPPTEPVDQGDEGEWYTVGEPAGSRSPAPTVEELLAQMERQPQLLKGAQSPQPLLLKKWWPQKRRRALHLLLLPQKRQRPQRRKRRRPPRLGWWTSPASLAPRP